MTSIVTISCPEGIVMGADSRITRIDLTTKNITFDDGVLKIYKLENYNIVIGYWGHAPSNSNFQAILENLENQLDETNENVDTVGAKLKEYLESNYPKYDKEMGYHIAGYLSTNSQSKPRIRHVFHVSWCNKGIFINENSNQEYHEYNIKINYAIEKTHLALFNGENSISNAFFNLIPSAFGDRELRVGSLNLSECVELAELIIDTTIKGLKFFVSSHDFTQRANQITGGDIVLITITDSGFNDVRNYQYLKGNDKK